VALQHIRNFGIVALLALGVWALPGGSTAANLFGAFLFVIVTAGIALLAARFYLENRSELYSLGDGWRVILYLALGVLVLDLAAGPKLFGTGLGTGLWVLLFAAALYALYAVFRHSREY
jgi:hypothetical protein